MALVPRTGPIKSGPNSRRESPSAVAKGEAVCPPCLSAALFRSAASQTGLAYSPAFRSDFGLSVREQQLVNLIRLGLTNKEIATRLTLSEQTVKNHVHRVLRKVGASDRYQILERCGIASLMGTQRPI